MVYIDTSVLVAYYCPESLSDNVESLLLSIDRPVLSQLTDVELASALARKIREGALTHESGNKILSLLNAHIAQKSFIHLLVQDEHFKLAREWISRFDTPLRTLDALHLSIAKINRIPILTADINLAKSARILGVDVQYVSQP